MFIGPEKDVIKNQYLSLIFVNKRWYMTIYFLTSVQFPLIIMYIGNERDIRKAQEVI